MKAEPNQREQRPWWVGLVGLFSLVLGITLLTLIPFTIPTLPAPHYRDDLWLWAFLVGFWLCPLVLGYSFVLTTLRTDPAQWRRGAYLFMFVLAYLAIAATLGATSGS
jgi:uncharacterized protein YqhQ